MTYLETYKGYRLMTGIHGGVYCYDRMNRKSKDYSTLTEIRQAIREGSIEMFNEDLSKRKSILDKF